MEPPQTPHYSRRTDFGPPDPLFAQMRSLSHAKSPFFDLTSSSPALAGIRVPHPLELLKGAAPDYSPDPRGLKNARLALCENYAPRASITPEQILLTASTSEAYSFALHVLCDPGDRILVPRPSYPLFAQLAQLAGVELVPYRIAYDGAFHTDLATLPTREQVSAQGIKALFAVSPNNPTGNCLRQEDLQRFSSLSIPLVVDEVFRPYMSAVEVCDPLKDAESHPLVVVVDGLSKRAAAPGLKLGWMLAAGRGWQSFLERAEWVSDAYLSAGSLVQHSLPQILEREEDIQRDVVFRIQENRRHIAAAGLEAAGITELRTDGGFTALLRFPGTLSEDEWWRELSSQGIWLHAGQLYELEQAPAFALSLLTPVETLTAALRHMRALVLCRT